MQQFAGGVGSVSSQLPKDFVAPGPSVGETNVNTPESSNERNYWDYTDFPQRPTNITQEWAQYLNPIVRSANRSVFDLIMQENNLSVDPQASNSASHTAEEALVWLMTNGLARIGFENTL